MLRIVKGRVLPEEVAALAVVLLARTAAPVQAASLRRPAAWRRPERAQRFMAPHSWQR
ncbi:acyl-CoA carboxylase epsilon subunit [Streptomyces cynarae]|uniref:acyl-CoA carboxylase epsilon subunit n=1 Tax=Streptomyces cynarae TaxID=2981134 RepID=UPI0036F391B1